MRRLEFFELDAVFEEVEGAVIVTQGGRTYRARKWRLTDGLEATIRTAIRYGYSKFWVEGHPSSPYFAGGPRYEVGSHHITFARSHHEKWVFVADKPPTSHEICFSKRLREFFDEINMQHEWEHSGGHNLRIPLEKLEFVLQTLTATHVDRLQNRPLPTPFFGRSSAVGLGKEEDLHQRFLKVHLAALQDAGFQLHSKLKTGPKSVPDLMLDARDGGLFVIELKFSHVGMVELDQLLKYLTSRGVLERSQGRQLHGVLIGRDFSQELIDAAEQLGGRVALYAFSHVQGSLGLQLIAGPRTLMDHVPLLFEAKPPDPVGWVRPGARHLTGR